MRNVNAAVTLQTKLLLPLAAVVVVGEHPPRAPEAYDSEVVHCQLAPDQVDTQASACNNAMCHFRLSRTGTNR